MAFSVELSTQAQSDIEETYNYISKDSLAMGSQWSVAIQQAIQTLKSFPERCSFAPERYYSEEEIRQLLFGSYRILFVIENEKIQILTIRHIARKLLQKKEIESSR